VPVNGAGKLLGFRVLAAAAIALACALASPSLAAAEQFSVNTTSDESDAAAGNEFCETATGKCSLRAAIEEANDSVGEFDEVVFEEGVFEGRATDVIALGSALPTIVDPIRIFGRECETVGGPGEPCVEIRGLPSAPALSVEGVEGAEFESLAVTGAEVGLLAKEAAGIRVRGSWFGITLDGSAAGNATGIELADGSDGARIGGEGPEPKNLLANSAGTGLTIVGSSRARVLGNDFGVALDGDAAPNGTDLAIASHLDLPALDNVIGTRVSPAAATTPACDGGCNLISGSETNGIDLTGSAGSGPASGTTVAGNHIGLNRAGDGPLANADVGVLVGAAPRTVVGGPRPEDANRIAGGTVAIAATGSAPYLVVRGNSIGSAATASGSASPLEGGIVVDSGGLTLAAEEAQILDNEIGLAGGTGIAHAGLAGEISGNYVGGTTTGIELGSSESLVESNTVEAPEDVGILVENGFNSLLGNHVLDSGGAGVRVEGSGLFGVSGNVIGGASAASENVLAGSHGNAIEIVNPKASRTEVARNRGSGNGGLFIDLVASEPDPADLDPGDPNGGVLPPAIALVSGRGAAGFAEPGATVRVFRKAGPAPGEIEAFLGQTSADAAGNWSLGFPAPLPPATAIAATQTFESGTSELGITAVPLAEDDQRGQDGGGAASDRRPPRTRMLKQPRRVRAGRPAVFSFTSNEAGSSFQCRLDRAVFRPCRSPKRYRVSKPGKHLFRVRAIDPAGNVDRTPVRRRFEVIG
jgi:CSLREA domain-containing protein